MDPNWTGWVYFGSSWTSLVNLRPNWTALDSWFYLDLN